MRKLSILVLTAILAGCATTKITDDEALNTILIEGAKATVRHYFYDHPQPERIQRFREIAAMLLQSEQTTTVTNFEAIALAEVAKTSDPLKRADAEGLVKSLAAFFRSRVGDGIIEPDKAIKIKEAIAALVAALPSA